MKALICLTYSILFNELLRLFCEYTNKRAPNCPPRAGEGLPNTVCLPMGSSRPESGGVRQLRRRMTASHSAAGELHPANLQLIPTMAIDDSMVYFLSFSSRSISRGCGSSPQSSIIRGSGIVFIQALHGSCRRNDGKNKNGKHFYISMISGNRRFGAVFQPIYFTRMSEKRFRTFETRIQYCK